MSAPLISVVMPAYNSGKYLRQAIDSILQQTLTDFEFIIINDGSSDDTEQIILSYSDPRIVYVKNEVNRGLIVTLNRGLEYVKGKYVARMDGDDVSLSNRFQKQLEYLEKNTKTDVLATCVTLIDEHEKDIGSWAEDKQHTNAHSIRKSLPVNNCIAHPTVMAKSEVMLKYKYNDEQKLSEDYDLWLRITADGGTIDKLSEPLLLHRILQTSFTRTRKLNVFYRVMVVKLIFVKNQLAKGKINGFVLATLLHSKIDGIKGTGKFIKNLFFPK